MEEKSEDFEVRNYYLSDEKIADGTIDEGDYYTSEEKIKEKTDWMIWLGENFSSLFVLGFLIFALLVTAFQAPIIEFAKAHSDPHQKSLGSVVYGIAAYGPWLIITWIGFMANNSRKHHKNIFQKIALALFACMILFILFFRPDLYNPPWS